MLGIQEVGVICERRNRVESGQRSLVRIPTVSIPTEEALLTISIAYCDPITSVWRESEGLCLGKIYSCKIAQTTHLVFWMDICGIRVGAKLDGALNMWLTSKVFNNLYCIFGTSRVMNGILEIPTDKVSYAQATGLLRCLYVKLVSIDKNPRKC